VAGLLVSVRSAVEALAALAGGAAVIDVKEPDRGPLGCAEGRVWSAVRRVVPNGVPVSVALGELSEWQEAEALGLISAELAGISYIKLGLAGATPDWAECWAKLKRAGRPGPQWVAVAYADCDRAGAPHPAEILDEALRSGDCVGILLDTWDKTRPSPISVSPSWSSWFARARRGGLLTALAGGLDEERIDRLGPLDPDLFAVRGAACRGGDRRGTVDASRVARLARAAGRAQRVC
jgi:uncharacterized protein (UPF0264 family)